jgi:hypothetical protein
MAVSAACSHIPAAESALADALEDRVAVLVAEGELGSPAGMSDEEARCWGREMASSLGVERWAELGVAAPDYSFPGNGNDTEADLDGIYSALSHCVPDSEMLKRQVTALWGPVLSESEIDCFVEEMLERNFGPREYSKAIDEEPEVVAALEACGLDQ